MAWTSHSRYTSKGYEAEITGLSGLPTDRTVLRTMHAMLRPVCAPARDDPKQQRTIASELTRTLEVTAGRTDSGDDEEVKFDTWMEELSAHPAQCVVRALQYWRRKKVWRPALAEILEDVEWRATPRFAALRSVETALGGAGLGGAGDVLQQGAQGERLEQDLGLAVDEERGDLRVVEEAGDDDESWPRD